MHGMATCILISLVSTVGEVQNINKTARIFLKDTSQRGSHIRRFGSVTAAFISDYNDTYKQVHK